MNKNNKKVHAVISLCLLGSCLGYFFYQSIHFPIHDFSNSYYPAYFLTKGTLSEAIFGPSTFNKMIFDSGGRNIFANFNPNPPFVALFFTPIVWMPVQLAKMVFN